MVPEAQTLLGLQANYVAASTPGNRAKVIAAAKKLTDLAERGAREEPKTEREILLAVLAEAKETNRLLAALLVSGPGSSRRVFVLIFIGKGRVPEAEEGGLRGGGVFGFGVVVVGREEEEREGEEREEGEVSE